MAISHERPGPSLLYLRIKVKQHQEAATLGQAAYAQKLLKKAGMQDCNSCQAPMEVRLKMTKASSTPMVDSTMWRSLVGILWYLVHTWPDISFAIGYVNRYMEQPHEEHLAAVKHILRYIAGTIDNGIAFPKRGLQAAPTDRVQRQRLGEGGGGGTSTTGRAPRE